MSQQSIARSIQATEKIRKITRAMQLVSVNHLARASALHRAGQPYADGIVSILAHWMRKHEGHHHPYFDVRPVRRQLVLVYGSDRGLCGALNLNVLKMAVTRMSEDALSGIDSHVVTVGEKIFQFFSKRGFCIEASVSKLGLHPHIQKMAGIIEILVEGYMTGQYDRVLLVYPKYVNTMTQEPVIDVVLPIDPAQVRSETALSDRVDYIYEPGVAAIVDRLLKAYIETMVFQAAVETLASEQAARMVAMQNATDNAESCKKDLERSYHRMRQAGITREIAEIIGGAEAT